MFRYCVWLFCVSYMFPFAWGQELLNSKNLFQVLNMTHFLDEDEKGNLLLPEELRSLRVAIFDDGFSGFKAGAKNLPPRTRLIKAKGNAPLKESHGYIMAQVFWASIGGAYSRSKDDGPELFLLHTNGLDNLEDAVDFCIENEIDIILQSKVTDWGSNFDGRGLINRTVDRAIDAGIIFINAAGNLHNTTYSKEGISLVRKDDGLDHIALPGPDHTLNFVNNADNNHVDISLSWSDFGEDREYASALDLDLYLYEKVKDSKTGEVFFEEIGISEKDQIGRLRPKDNPNSSINALALERITGKLGPGTYALKIIYRSGRPTFHERLRVVVDAKNRESLQFREAQGKFEIAAPADNLRVITVGALDKISSVGPTADGRRKPDIVVPNSAIRVRFGKETITSQGSSSAAAMFTGAATLMMARSSRMSTQKLMNYFSVLDKLEVSRDGIPIWRSPSPPH